jgi:hypothetical protein
MITIKRARFEVKEDHFEVKEACSSSHLLALHATFEQAHFFSF